MSGASLAQQNIYVVNAEGEWPERPDPYVIYHRTYDPDAGFYYWDGTAYVRIARADELITPGNLLGTYDIAADQTSLGGPLLAATNYVQGDYFICINGGTFPALPDIGGQTGEIGDWIIVTASLTWQQVPYSNAFLSSQVDDTAIGVITFNQPAKGTNPAVSAADYMRKQEYDSGLADNSAGDRAYTDAQIVNHENKPDPHPQYLTKTVAQQLFTFAAYGSMSINTPVAYPSLGAGWIPITNYDFSVVEPPRNVVVDLVGGTLSVDNEGVYLLSLTLIFEHDSSNQGRLTNVRFYNVTDDVVIGTPFTIGTGRNAEASQISVVSPFDIPISAINDTLQIQIGGGDSYTSVQVDSVLFGITGIGEYRGII